MFVLRKVSGTRSELNQTRMTCISYAPLSSGTRYRSAKVTGIVTILSPVSDEGIVLDCDGDVRDDPQLCVT